MKKTGMGKKPQRSGKFKKVVIATFEISACFCGRKCPKCRKGYCVRQPYHAGEKIKLHICGNRKCEHAWE